MESGNLDAYERAKRADSQRRKKAVALRRKRARRVRRIKLGILGMAVAIIAVSCIMYAIRGGKDNQASGNFEQKQAQYKVLEAAAQIMHPKDKLKYPSVSENYVEIVSEDIMSPYIALLDVENGEVIAGRAYNEKIYPASMTKVMTLIVAVENIKDLNQTYSLSYEEIDPLVRDQASRAGFDPDEEVTARDYLYGLILPSGADAAVALSNIAAGSEEAFVELMNKKCEELGLKNTHFVNSSGLYDEEQYTTPVEMALIMQCAMTNETCAQVLSTYQYTTSSTGKHHDGILLTSTMFSRMYGTEVEEVTITAGKTGYTEEAGNCLVSYAKKGGRHYIALTAGASYKWHTIFDDFEIYENYLP